VSVPELDEIYEQQEAFRESEQAAVEQATTLPVDQARAQLDELAQRQQEWIAEQHRMLRDRVRQHAQTGRAVRRLDQVDRDLSRGRGWSL
jgi:hypothetical protein